MTATAPRLGPDESRLLSRINAGPTADTWTRYHALTAARVAGTLAPADHPELVRLTDVVEGYQADRVAALAELAARRGQTLGALADALGLAPRGD